VAIGDRPLLARTHGPRHRQSVSARE